MKTRNCFCLLTIFFVLFVVIFAADRCPAGMRKTYIDDTNTIAHGSGYSPYGAICFYDDPGSLFLKRKILIEPRFEVHLKTTINPVPVIENAREQRIYGFTIVISGSQANTISGMSNRVYKTNENLDTKVYDDIGYNNFVNSLIVEFDFFKDRNDPDSSSYSIRYCSRSCNSNDRDRSVLVSRSLNNQKYELNKQMNWDFTLIYDNQVLRLVQGSTELYRNNNYNLVNVLGTHVATVGFTGFLEGNNRELSLIGTFVCEDNYEIPKMLGYFYINSKSNKEATYNAGSPISFKFSFINNRGQTIPHTYGYNIWSYSFSVTSDCSITSNSLQKLGNSKYDLVLNTKACGKAGRHAIYLSERLKGKGPAIYYTVKAGAFKKINLVGHDGKIGAVPSKKISNYLLLTYGTSPSGNFIMKKNAVLVLDFDFVDEYGNSLTVNSPANYFTFRRVYDNGDIFPVTNKFLSFQVNRVNEHYQLVITVYQMATYQIEKNSYLSETIRFIVVPGEVSPALSYCTLNGSPAIECGSRLFVADCTGGMEQKWRYNSDGSLTNFAGDLCADVPECSTYDRQIIIYRCHIADKRACTQSRNQQWDFKSDGTIVTRMGTNKCLHVNGNIVQTHVCNRGANQKFEYRKEDSTIRYGNNKCFSPFDLLDKSLKTITSPPTLSLNENVYYMCYFKDDYGNDITTKYFLQNSIYDFVCENQRLSPTSKTYKTQFTDKVTYSVSKYVTSETGKFEINGYLVKKGTNTRAKITPKINQFTVKGTANTYVLKNVLNLQNKNWVNINGAQINYIYDKGGLITVVDFAESDGFTLISSYGRYPSDFKVSNLKAEIFNSHDNNFKFGELETSIITLNGKQYVGIYTKGRKPTDTVIKKSSFDYSIKLTYQKGSTSEQKIVTLKYIINIGSYKTCFHNLDIGKSIVNIGSSLSFLVGENEKKIATIELRTIDNYLYNYDIGKDKIQFLLDPLSPSITFRVLPLSIEGTYDIFAKPVSDYQGNLNIKINGQQKKKIPINSRREACYLEFLKPALFTHLKTNFKEHYYEYKGSFVNGSFDFLFKILDKNKKVIVKDDYFATYADIYSEQYGNDKTKFTVYYNKNSAAFEFKDNLPYANQKLTWVFFMRDSTCNNKYYIKYDGLKGGAPLDLSKSLYNLLNTKINIKEYAYVDVIYRDIVNLYYGLQNGKLEEMKKTTVVKGKRTTDGKEVIFAFDSITKDYAIRYKYNFDLSGTFTVTATSNGKELKCNTKNSLEVIDNIYSLKHSKLKMILNTIIDMNPNVRTTIDNTIQRPVYKLYFYSATGVATIYTKDSVFTCKMTGAKVSLDLNVEKKTDHIQFTYQDKDIETFKNLVKGDYQLIIADKTSNVQYPLFLKGDGSSDASNDPNYDISKTEVSPTTISGVVGKTYQIIVELRAADGLRWNQLVDITKFSITNSRNLNSNSFSYKVEKGFKKGQAIISVTQTEASTNVLTLSYNGKQIPKTVTLKMSCGSLAALKFISGPTEGNVINPPILTFQPIDSYGNVYTTLFTVAQNANYLNSLTVGTSLDKAKLTPNNYLDKNKNYLLVQYKSTISNNVRVTSTYFKEQYNYRIKSGPIDTTTSYAELLNGGTKEVIANYNIRIYPKDKYNNYIDNLNTNDMNNFYTYYQFYQNKYNISSSCNLKTNVIECAASINKAGSMEFNVEYVKNKILCKNCKFSVTSNTPVFANTKTYYTNRKIFLESNEYNQVEAKNNPLFELTFFDNYSNQMGEAVVQKLNVEASFVGIDIKLCVTNSKEKKLVNLCPVSNGDDNLNKWQYLVNGKYFNLTINEKNNVNNKLIYPIEITGGAVDGSFGKEDLSQTYFEPTTIVTEAGVEGKTIMEIRTIDKDNNNKNKRKNYWYPNPSEKIKVEFEKDQNTCSYKIDRANLPGQYAIKIVCTKTTDSNSFIVTVESTKLTEKKINVKITRGRAYYLEVENASIFAVHGDKYTWKANPTNDDIIKFNFKLKDKYQNYITTNVLNNNEITVTAANYGQKYNLLFDEKNKNYLFEDKIDVLISSHIWNIICVDSKRQYSFIYSKVAGKPNLDKSYWTIDKNEYVIGESSTVTVYLLDKFGVNVGTISGNLANLNKNVQISVLDKSDNKVSKYNYNSITKENGLKYLYNYIKVGNYEVSVTYENKLIKQKVNIKVIYQKVSLKSSKLHYVLGNKAEILMYAQKTTQINNLRDYPFYKFYLYTEQGKAINNYDHTLNAQCKMTYASSSVWILNVLKKDSYLHLAYADGFVNTFKRLPLGDYKLEITFDKETIVYPLHLLGEKNVSPNPNYDLTKTDVKPRIINGVAGVQYPVDIEFRASDNLRWNYDIILDSFEVATNSYNLNTNQLKIVKQKGEKNGQIKLLITQYVATIGGKNNVLTMKYKNGLITQTIELNIKCAAFKSLEYVDGAKDGTVINPPILQFIPKDIYGNLFTDLFNEKLYPKKELEKLTTGVSVEKYPLTTNSYVSKGQFLNVQYGCTKITTIKVTARNNPKTYQYKLWSGPMEAKTSIAQVENTKNVIAGQITIINIYPKDIYGNSVTQKMTIDDLNKINVEYEVNKNNKANINKTCIITKDNIFKCSDTITKTGEVLFDVEYGQKDIPCSNCKFNINPDKIDLSKTKVYNKNGNNEMSTTTLNTLPSSTTPKFELFFFDKYNNAITSKTDVSALTVTTDFVVSDVKLCVTNNGLTKLSTVCKSANNDENEEKWKYLTNGDKYKLIVNGSKNDKSLEFPVKVTGGYTDGDSAPIDLSKTFLNPAILTLIAGESQSILLELRTKSDIRKNYWFTELNKHISIKFPDNVNKCQYSIEKAQKPGQYSIIFVCTEKKDAFNPTILVENAELPKKLSITVNPNVPALSRVFKMTGEEIIESNLGSVSVDDKFQMKTRLYDKYNNLITAVKSYLKSLQIEIKPNENVPAHKSSAQTLEDKDGVIIISLISTYAGKHTVVGAYFPQNYNIQFTHGVPDDNSLLEVSHTERIAGEDVKIYITPYDQYNNYIDAIELKDKNPYQTKYTNEGSNNELLMGKYSVEKYNGKNVLSYPGVFYVRGIASIFGYIGGKGLKCVTCRINIKSKDVYFPKSEVLRFVSSKKDFETLKNGAVEKNVEEEPVYRLYPRDQYENIVDVIPQATLLTYKAYLASQNESTVYHLKLNNNQTVNQSYAEFVINDIEGAHVTYKTLVGGYYDLVFTNGKDKLVYNITLLGDGKGGSNEAADIQKTAIVEQNLKYLAGKTGYMIVEIRTKRDIRKNFWDGFNIRVESCDANDKTFNYTQEHGGLLGVFLITVSTEKANTYPKLSKCQLKIYVNNELVKKLSPEQEVSPNAVVRTKILENYYKDGKSSAILKDGTADKNYEFEVASYDKYNNLAQTLQEVVGIKVKYEGKEEISKTNSVTEISTGYRKYVVPATKSGNYVINTEKSGSQGLYFNETTFKIHPGAIDLSKTVVNEKLTPIKAGEKPSINIKAFDKYGNALYPDDYIMKFTSIFIDANKISHTSKGQKENEMDVFYSSETPVTIVGNVNVEVTYEKKNKIDTSDADIEVIPAEPYAPNSILLRETSEGVYTKYKNGSSFQIDTKETLSLNVTLYDKYNNLITDIPADSEILKPLMSGNYMEEIIFNVTENTKYFNLDFNENHDYTHIYQHLVGGTYDLTYTVKTSLGEASFKYNMVIPGGDGKHGNGRYVIGKCVITPQKISFMAGTYGEFSLELRNAQGLLYNDDINITSDIDIENVEKDPTFVSTVEKADPDYYGVYTIKIYSEKKGDRSIYALLADITIKERTKKRVGPGYYNVYPEKVPDRRFTVFTIPPEPKVNYNSMYEMQFILADKFNNSFEGRNDIVDDKYLTLLNNEEPLSYASLTLSPDKQTYKLSVYPKYPPKTMSMNILYNDGEDTVYCFLNNTIVTIMVGIDYSLTQIVSSNKEKIKAGEKLDMWLYTFDKQGECIDDQDYSQDYEIEVTGPMDSTKQSTKKYSVKNIVKKELECNNEYQIITTDDDKYKYAGNYIIKVHAKGLQNPIASYNQVCLPLGYSLNGFSLDYTFDPNKISILDKVSFTVTGTDMYGNKVTDSLINDLEIYFTKDGKKTIFESKKSELTSGTLDFNDVAIHLVGPHQLHMTYKGQEVLTVNNGKKLPIFTILVGPCRSNHTDNFNLDPLNDITTNTKTSFSFQCYDIYNNTITKGGEKFTVISQRNENGILIDVDAEIEDNLDGTYTVKFVPEVEGLYIFNFLVDSEKYGEEIQKELKNKVCEGENSNLCPNKRICVKDLIDCVEPPDKCKEDKTKPFWCPVNGKYTCTKSQIDCDCPKGYIRCNIQKYCVPKDRKDMCATPMLNNNFCKINLGNNYKMFEDGYCRLRNYRMPNQRVCPIGKVLCADLSCRDSYDDCMVSEVREGTDIRCVGQQLVSNIKDCPSTITCEKETEVVCPDGSCVENEIYCKALTKCNDDKLPYLCQNNNCAADFDSCPSGITCGHKDSLCSDGVCREKC